MRKITLFLMMFVSLLGFTQNTQQEQNEGFCGLQNAYNILEKEGKLEAYHQWHHEQIQELKLHKTEFMNRSVNTIYQVPVVVHIVWDNQNGLNVTDEQVATMIENLNKDYARENIDADQTREDFLPVASSVDIRFCLAKQDPDGNGTTGIVRRQTTHGWFNPGDGGNAEDIKHTDQGGDDAWDTELYLNIWIGDLTNGEGQGIMGYSTLPGSHGNDNDGFIMDCMAVAAGQLTRTPTHEIGHYFGLHHPWGPGNPGEPVNPQAPDQTGGDCEADDGFDDTPTTDNNHLGGSCDDTFVNCGSEDQFENFMGYSNCTNMFTAEQAAFMKSTLETTRASLLNDKCNAPVLTANFSPDQPTITVDAGTTITYEDLSSGPVGIETWNWSFPGGTPNSSNTGGTQNITYNEPGIFNVSLTVTDNTGDNDTKTVEALVEVVDVLNANFVADITYAAIGEGVTFTDLSSGPNPIVSWNWNFGDGTTADSQNATHAYNNDGLYTVKLKVNDGAEENTETKTEYIQVYDPNALNIIDFTGTPTTINAGQSVSFELEANQSDNLIDSVRWIFTGADQASVFKTNTNPFNVTYSTGGVFDVEARVYKDYGNDGDTLVKQGYIVVISPENVPVANFSATNTNIAVGSTIDFINLTENIEHVDSVHWTIETGAGTPLISNNLNPAGITYNTVGDYTATLKVFGVFGNDSITKTEYIHVYDPQNMGDIQANFEAITPRLITVGESVRFEDLSEGDIENWAYIFDRGAGDDNLEFSTQQNPEHVFAFAGHYNVTLVASNQSYSDTIMKDSYVVVTTSTWPGGGEGYCDTISSLHSYETETSFKYLTAEPEWGVFPGHCALTEDGGSSAKKIKQYAQKFTTYQPDYISGVLIPVSKAFSGDPEASIRVRIWDANAGGRPNNVISGPGNKVKINSLEEHIYNYIKLKNPVEVDSVFFVGFKLDYQTETSPQDTFATYIVDNRVEPSQNTLYISKSGGTGNWQTPADYFDPDIYTAMDIRLISCIVSVEEIEEIANELTLYPNPSNGEAFADFGSIFIKDIKVDMMDVVGKRASVSFNKTDNNRIKLNFSNNHNGMYFIRFTINGYELTKKVLLYK